MRNMKQWYYGIIVQNYYKEEINVEEIKAFNLRLPKEIWQFLKLKSLENEKPMTELIINCLDKYKKRSDKYEEEKLYKE